MIKKVSILLILCGLFHFGKLGISEDKNSPFVLSATTEKTEFVLYEPIVLGIVVQNVSDQAVEKPSADIGEGIGLWITDSEGTLSGYTSMTTGCAARIDPPPMLEPKMSVASRNVLSWNYGRERFTFPAPGTYIVEPKLAIGALPSGATVWLPGNTLKIQIRDVSLPAAVDSQDIAEMLGNQIIVREEKIIEFKGQLMPSIEPRMRSSLTQVRERQESFLKGHAKHPLAPYIQLALGRSLTFEHPRNPARAVDLLLDYADRYKSSWLAPNALLDAAAALARGYREKDAAKILDKLVASYPDFPMMSSVESVRHDLQSGAFVNTNVHEEREDEEALKDKDHH